MTAYDDLMRSLLVERFAPVPARTEPEAGDRLAELTAALRDERPTAAAVVQDHQHPAEDVMTGATMQLTDDELRALPSVVDVPTAAAILGIGRTAAYELIRTKRWPTPVLRLGKLIRIPTAPLLALVGVSR